MNSEEQNVIAKIKKSEYFNNFIQDIGESARVIDSGSYIYRPDDFNDHYLVVIRVDSNSRDKLNLIFKMTEDDQIVDAEAHVDFLGGVGEPDAMEGIHIEDSLQDKIRKLKDD